MCDEEGCIKQNLSQINRSRLPLADPDIRLLGSYQCRHSARGG